MIHHLRKQQKSHHKDIERWPQAEIMQNDLLCFLTFLNSAKESFSLFEKEEMIGSNTKNPKWSFSV